MKGGIGKERREERGEGEGRTDGRGGKAIFYKRNLTHKRREI